MANQRISPETAARIAAAWPAILHEIAAGALIAQTVKAAGFTMDMMRAYRALDPANDAAWARAKEDSADAFTEEGLAVARKPIHVINPGEPGNENGTQPLLIPIDPASARVHVDYLKWIAAKRNPRTYSDKSQVDVNVRTVDLTRIIQDANARLAAQRATPIELKPGTDGVYQLPAELQALL